MKKLFSAPLVFVIVLALAIAASVAGADKPAPDKLVFQAKMGDVTFNHAAHVKRANNDCKTCHDKLFKQDASAPLGFKPGMHKPAEAKKTSCGACHHAGGPSFTTKGNCKKCHVKK